MIFFPKKVKVIKTAGAYNDGGIWEEAETETAAMLDIQPLSAEQMQKLPENWNLDKGAVRIYSATKLNGWTETGRGDVVVHNNLRYRVYSADCHSHFFCYFSYYGVGV